MRLRLAAVCLLAAATQAPAQAQAVTDNITRAQARLPTIPLTITTHDGTKHTFTIEQATTLQQQTTGEMFRTLIPANEGMLFMWDPPRESQMWMRNCPVPEDMVFIGTDNKISHIAENTVPQSLAIVDSGGPVRATLELQGGITDKLGIEVGDAVGGGPFAR